MSNNKHEVLVKVNNTVLLVTEFDCDDYQSTYNEFTSTDNAAKALHATIPESDVLIRKKL